MKSIILVILVVTSFSLGITAYIWDQLAVAIAFTIIFPVISLYYLISGRYKYPKKENAKKRKKNPVDNYFQSNGN